MHGILCILRLRLHLRVAGPPATCCFSIGLPHAVAHGSLRLSFSDQNTEDDIDAILAVLPGIISRLRAASPLWEEIQTGAVQYDIQEF